MLLYFKPRGALSYYADFLFAGVDASSLFAPAKRFFCGEFCFGRAFYNTLSLCEQNAAH